MFVIVNPTHKKPRSGQSRPKRKPAHKAIKGAAMKHRTAAQKRATKRLVAYNKAKHRNPAHHAKRRNPTHHYKAKRRNVSRGYRAKRRNPSFAGMHKGATNLFARLISKEGLIGIGTIVAAPTVLELAMGYIAPTSTGYTRIGIKTALGVAAAWAVHRFVSKDAGFLLGLASVGIGATEAIQEYRLNAATANLTQYGPTSTPTITAQGYTRAVGATMTPATMAGYLNR
jgi:hypothetical protein